MFVEVWYSDVEVWRMSSLQQGLSLTQTKDFYLVLAQTLILNHREIIEVTSDGFLLLSGNGGSRIKEHLLRKIGLLIRCLLAGWYTGVSVKISNQEIFD